MNFGESPLTNCDDYSLRSWPCQLGVYRQVLHCACKTRAGGTLRVPRKQNNKAKTQHVQDQRGGRTRFQRLVENLPLGYQPVRVHYVFLVSKKISLKHSTCKTSAGCRSRYPLLVENFPHWQEILFFIWTYKYAQLHPEQRKWNFFHFSGKFSTSKNKKKNYSKIE